MADPREEKIRKELLGGSPPRSLELRRKYKIDNNTVSRIRGELGIGRHTHYSRVKPVLEKNPDASDREIAAELGINPNTVTKHRAIAKYRQQIDTQKDPEKQVGQEQLKGTQPPIWEMEAPNRTSDPPPKPPRRPRKMTDVEETQWMFRQSTDLRNHFRYTLRKMDEMGHLLRRVTQFIDVLRPYEIWVKNLQEGAPGYGSLALFLAERSGDDIDTLKARLRKAEDNFHQLLGILEETNV